MCDEFGDAGEDVPEPGFGEAAFAKGGGSVEELGAHLVAIVHGVVEAFLEVFFADDLVDLDDVHEVLGCVVRDGGFSFAGLCGGDVEDVEDEDGVVGDDGAAGLGDEVGVLDAGFVADLGDDFDDVGAVFLDGVVAGGVEVGV